MTEPVEVAERLNVALIPEARDALVRLRARTSMRRVDLINRAIQVFEFIDAEQRAGGTIMVRDASNHCQDVKIT